MKQPEGAADAPPIKVHPAAAIFPMMTDAELQTLAEDIRERGLIHPIVVDAEGQLIDGRNRLRACEIAEVTPTFAPLNGHDAVAFIVSANLNRRDLKKSQKAMALAMLYPEDGGKGGRGKKDAAENLRESRGFSRDLLFNARAVLRHSRGLADEVLADRTALDAALNQARDEQAASASKEAQMARLRAGAPDVAALVDDDRLTLVAGMAELATRQAKIAKTIDAGRSAVTDISHFFTNVVLIKSAKMVTNEDLLAAVTEEKLEQIIKSANELLTMKRDVGRKP